MNSSLLGGKLLDVRRSSENQSARCKIMLKKLKVIQLQELEEYGEQQFDSVIKVLAQHKGIHLKEAIVPDFLQKRKLPIPPPEAFEAADYIQRVNPWPPQIDSKHGLADLEDVSEMLRHSIRELLLSTGPLGKDGVDTDSCSDAEDEVQTHISTNCSSQTLVYLPVERNPSTRWAKARLDIMTKFAWLNESLKTVDQRITQHDQLLQYIRQHKPCFKFDEAPKSTKPVIIGANLDFATIKLYREDSERNTLPSQSTTLSNMNSPTFEKTDNLIRTIGNFRKNGEGPSSSFGGPGGLFKRNHNTVGGGLEPLRLKIMDSPDPDATARRCIGVIKPFKHRKVLQIGGIHNIVGKPQPIQPTTLCPCFGRTELCIICSGRSDKIKRVRPGAMSKAEMTALLDHNYHKVLSASEEKPLRLLTEAALKTMNWTKLKKSTSNKLEDSDEEEGGKLVRRCLKTATIRPAIELSDEPTETSERKVVHRSPYVKKVLKADKKTRKRKRPSDEEEEEEEEEEQVMSWIQKKSKSAESTKKRRTGADEKYDIDHIVIPYSIAAATRVEKIEYKEIDIPSWRTNYIQPRKKPPPPKVTRNTRTSRNRVVAVEPEPEDVEDITLETVTARHLRSEEDEKKRFLKAMNVLSNRRSRRSETTAENSDFSQPTSPIRIDTSENIFIKEEVISPAPNQISAADASLAVTALKISVPIIIPSSPQQPPICRRRTISSCKVEEPNEDNEEPGVSPFEPRKFPLSDDEYAEMIKEMKESYQEEDMLERHNSGSSILYDSRQRRANDTDDSSEVEDTDWRELTEISVVIQ